MDRGSGGSSSRPRRLLAPLAAAVALVPAGVAHAQQAPPPGVHIDPGSPTAKEYAVPFDAARAVGRGKKSGQVTGASGGSGGSGGGRSAGSSSDSSPLFGVGISRRRSTQAGSSGTSGSSAGGARSASSGTAAARSGFVPGLTVKPTGAHVPTATATGDTGGTSPLLLVGAILAAGLLIGVPLRRLGRTPGVPGDTPEPPAAGS